MSTSKTSRFDQLVAAWVRASRADAAIAAFWFECDHRQELLEPKEPFAFHLAVRDEAYEEFLQRWRGFVETAGPLQTADLVECAWQHPPMWKVLRNLAESGVNLQTCWLTFADGCHVDLVLERQSKIGDVPRAFWKVLYDDGLGVQQKVMRGRIGKRDRMILKRPARPDGC